MSPINYNECLHEIQIKHWIFEINNIASYLPECSKN